MANDSRTAPSQADTLRQAQALSAALDAIEARLDALELGADADVIAKALADPVRAFDAAVREANR